MKLLGYGLGFYRVGAWFGFGQVQLYRWGVQFAFFKHDSGHYKYWIPS